MKNAYEKLENIISSSGDSERGTGLKILICGMNSLHQVFVPWYFEDKPCNKNTKEKKHMYNQTKRMMAIGGFCLISSIALSAQISLKLHNKKTSDVITEIEQVSDYRFFYNNGLSGLSKVISVQADNADIRSVLEQIKQQTGISYLIKDNKQIVLSASESSQQQRNVTVHGTVTDTQGLPIIGANILEKGTTNGTITDIDGKFTLTVSENAMLQISYIGCVEQSVSVKGKNVLNIKLKEDSKSLDEVVVVAFGTQKKSSLTAAVATVDSKEIAGRSVANISQALQGVSPGLNITAANMGGALNNNPSIDNSWNRYYRRRVFIGSSGLD